MIIKTDAIILNRTQTRMYDKDDGLRGANFREDVLKAAIGQMKKTCKDLKVLDYKGRELQSFHAPTYL